MKNEGIQIVDTGNWTESQPISNNFFELIPFFPMQIHKKDRIAISHK